MATFDQLPADQRAIIELLLKRGRSYDALSDMLDMPASRVRELAREALTELAPVSASRVDPDWRDQVADYVLGQQSGPESAATQGHLKRSEPARAWLTSLLDSLDQLYTNGNRPELPEFEGDRPARARDRKGRGGRGAVVTEEDEDDTRERARARRDRDRDRDEDDDEKETKRGKAAGVKDRDRKDSDRKERDRDREDRDDAKRPSPLSGGRAGGPLSPAARAAVMRRRLIGGAVALILLVLLVLVLTGTLFGGDDNKGSDNANRGSDTQASGQQAQTTLVGQLQLDPVGKQPKDTIGIAAFAKTGNKNQLAIQAKLPAVGSKEAYEVWLYNSKDDAISIGAQKPDAQGNYQGAGEIPADYAKYKYIDVSLEKIDQNRKHSGNSVLRGALANIQAPQQQPNGGAGGSGGTGGTGAAPGGTGAAPGGTGAAPGSTTPAP